MLQRDTVLLLGYIVLLTGLLALVLKGILLGLAMIDWMDVRLLPADHPDRLVAIDQLWNDVGRVANVVIIAVVGLAWVITISGMAATDGIRATPVSLMIVASYVIMAALAVAQGMRELVTRRRLMRAFRQRRDDRPPV